MNDSSTEAATVQASADDRPCVIPRAAATRLGLLMVALGGNIEELAREPLAGLGLSGHDYTVLAILDVDGPGTQHEIARLMNKAPGVIVAAVDQLESKGYVGRQRDPADRRRSRVTPTPAGRAVLGEADKVGDQLVADILSTLRPAELVHIRELLERGLELTSPLS